MGIKTKSGFGKLTGTATIIRKNGTREEVPFVVRENKPTIKKLVAEKSAKKEN